MKGVTMNEVEELRSRIHVIRGQQVMLDKDLAELYGVETSQLKRAVRRNLERFPSDFMFELNVEEFNSLKMSIRCQNGILETTPGDLPKYAPFAFTEHGVAMLSSVLRSKTAIIRQLTQNSNPGRVVVKGFKEEEKL